MLRQTAIVALALLLLSLLPRTEARAELVLNEVLYDPEGADEGLEFVELWNPDSVALSLDGIVLEAGDGSRPGTWTVLYAGSGSDSVAPGHAFLIPAASLLGTIQNGPDALRLQRAGRVLDLVGYGALAAAELYQGSPASDAPSGQSLARVRDGVDTGVNAADWAAEPSPTPGRANHPDVRLELVRGTVALSPELPWPGSVATFRVAARNLGRLAIAGTRWDLTLALRRPPDSSWINVAVAPGFPLAPGESALVRCDVSLAVSGRFDLRACLGDLVPDPGEPGIADTVLIETRAGAGPLVVQEIAFRDRGAGEWVELFAREDVPDLGAFSFSDGTGRTYAIDAKSPSRSARAGEILVLAQSPELLRPAYALPESLVLACRGGWPSLNDQDGDDGFADRVRIVDALGVPSDVVPYRSGYAEREGSIERLGIALPSASSFSWAESIDPRGGTPGRPNSVTAPPHDAGTTGLLLRASSRVVRRSPGEPIAPVILAFGDPAQGSRVRVFIHDLLGRVRRHLVDGQRVQGETAFPWDGRDDAGESVPAGAYIARAETLPDGDEGVKTGSLALTVADR